MWKNVECKKVWISITLFRIIFVIEKAISYIAMQSNYICSCTSNRKLFAAPANENIKAFTICFIAMQIDYDYFNDSNVALNRNELLQATGSTA